MDNTEKLLRAFIEASGFDIKEVKGISKPIRVTVPKDVTGKSELIRCALDSIRSADGHVVINEVEGEYIEYIRPTGDIDYKVTKRPVKILVNDLLSDFLNDKELDLVGGSMGVTVLGVAHIPVTIYADRKGEVAHPNPAIADCYGVFPDVWVDAPFRVTVYNRKGQPLINKDVYENI